MPTNTTINALLAAPDASPVPVAAVVAVAHARVLDSYRATAATTA